MSGKSVSASTTTVPSTSGSTESITLPQPKKAQVIFLQRSPKLIISRNGGEKVQHFILTQQPIVNENRINRYRYAFEAQTECEHLLNLCR